MANLGAAERQEVFCSHMSLTVELATKYTLFISSMFNNIH